MPNRTMPGLGLRAFNLGENGWDDEYNDDHRLLSALVNRRVTSRTATLPVTPALGDIYIVPSGDPTNPNKLAVWDGPAAAEAWSYYTPQEGWLLYVDDENLDYRYNGTIWTVATVEDRYLADTLINNFVLNDALTAAPGSPADGDPYIVAAGATGSWAAHDNELAVYQNGAWVFYTPLEGWAFYERTSDVNLQYNGATWVSPAGAGPASGGLEFIEAFDALNAATLDFTGLNSSLYDAYVFVLENIIPSLDGQSLFMRTSTDGGVSYDGGASDYIYTNIRATGGTVTNPNSTGSSALLLISALGSDAGEDGVSGVVYVPGPHLAKKTLVKSDLSAFSSAGALVSVSGSGARVSQSSSDAVRFLMGSGDIESGRIVMYGYRKSA